MKPGNQNLRTWLFALSALCAPVIHAGTVSTTFSFQKGNLLQDGIAYGSGTGYAGVVDGRVADNTAASVLTTVTTATLGNQYQAAGTHNGMQHCGLFSYDLTELNTFIAANTGSYSSVIIQSVSFQLTTSSIGSGTSMALALYGTDPFTSSGCTWSNYTTGTPWTNPYQSGRTETAYNFTGGPSALPTPVPVSLGGTNPSTGTTATPIGTALTWTSSANFVSTLTSALARPDKTLYLTARGTYFSNGDNRVNVYTSPYTTDVTLRPKLVINLQVTTTSAPASWTGATSNSWAAATNWSPSGVPATDAPINFDSSSTANLNTVLNQDFTVTSVTVASPSGAVSIGGANNLNLGAGGFDLSAATQNLTVSAPVVLGAIQSWNVASGRTLGVNGAVSGNFPLTLAGAGKVSLGASNILPNGASAGNLAVNTTLDLNGASQSVNGLTGSGILDNTAVGSATLTVGNNDAAGAFTGIIQDTGGALAVVKTGTGQLQLSGANDFSGGFTNNGAGSLVPVNNLAFGTGSVVSNAGQIYPTTTRAFGNNLTLNNSTLRIGGGNSNTITWNGPVTATGTFGLICDGGTGGITLGSTLNMAGATCNSSAGGTTNNITGNISGAGGILNVTAGTLQLSGANNTYGGTTTIGTSCFLRLDATGTLPASGNVVINGGGLTIRNTAGWTHNGTISGDGVGVISLNTGTNATLAGGISGVASINASTSGTNATISGPISGAANLSVQTAGATLTLSGTNAYTGTTTLTGGTLSVGTTTNLGDPSSSLVFNGGTLQITGTALTAISTIGHSVTFTAAKSVGLDINNAANTFNVDQVLNQTTGGFTKSGAGTAILSQPNSYVGATTISGGTLKAGNATALGFGGLQRTTTPGTTVGNGFTLDLNGTSGINEPITLNGTGIGGNGALVNNSGSPATIGNGIAGLAVAAAGSGTGYSTAPAVVISGTGTGATATASLGVTTQSFTIDVAGDRTYTVAPTVTISGGAGATAIATAVLSGGATGTVTGITVTSSGSEFTSAPTAVISGGTSTGTTTSTFIGNDTNFTVGGLTLTNAGSGYTGTPTVTFDGSPATVTPTLSSVILAADSSIGGTGNTTISGVVSGNSGLTKIGAGTLTLGGANTYTGATTVSVGTLALVGGSQASPINVDNLASLGVTLGSGTTSTSTVAFSAGSTVKITGTPAPATSYTLLTTSSSISGTPVLAAPIAGFQLQVDGGNTLKLEPIAAAGYSAWQSANSTAQAINLDHDNDGVSNGVEYFLGGDTSTTGFTALPGVSNTGGVLSVTWAKASVGYAGVYTTDFVVETSNTLVGAWTPVSLGVGPNLVEITGNNVKYTFPTGTKNFVRLKVTGP